MYVRGNLQRGGVFLGSKIAPPGLRRPFQPHDPRRSVASVTGGWSKWLLYREKSCLDTFNSLHRNNLQSLWQDTPRRSLLAVDTLQEVGKALSGLAEKLVEDDENAPRLVTSFRTDFPEALRDVGGTGGRVYVAAPYFGGSVAGVTHLHETLQPRELQVFPAVHSDGKLDVPVHEVTQLPNTSVHSLRLAKKSGFAHLKLFGVESSDGECWLLNGSMNCSEAALRGRSIEAGVLRRVETKDLQEYFATDEKIELPTEQRDDETEPIENSITLWATDLGDVVEVIASDLAAKCIPLKDVQLTVRSGSTRVSVQQAGLFEKGLTSKLPWSLFPQFRRTPHATRILEAQGFDPKGQAVRGVCFIDDLAALTSEPTHRGAWRAALTLLSAEAMPEYADIAALFQLVDDVVTVEEDEEASEQTPADPPAGSTRTAIRDKAAVWPPQPISAHAGAIIASHGSGSLFWFNRILASLVQRPRAGTKSAGSAIEDQDEEERERPSPRVISTCQRMWDKAVDGLGGLECRLHQLEVTKAVAHRVWGPAAFIFLSALGIKKAVEHAAPDEVETPSVGDICRDVLSTLFSARYQGDDYTPPRTCRYSCEYFPVLAADLSNEFDVHPHFEVCAIVLVTFAHVLALDQKDGNHRHSLLQWLFFCDSAGDNLVEAWSEEEHLQHIWQRYFDDGREGIDWGNVLAALDTLKSLDWSAHEGIKELRSHDRLIRSGKCETTEDFSATCANWDCHASGHIDPTLARLFRALYPVVCKACGHVIVPETLFSAYKRLNDGKTP